MRIGLIKFPGSTGYGDLKYALETFFNKETLEIWHKENDLKEVDALLIPAGSAFGDYLRPGAFAKHSPVMQQIIKFAWEGKPILGIGNGFQILCEAGLLPGSFLINKTQQFICKNVFIKADNNHSPITADIEKNEVLKIPVAHMYGSYHASQDTLIGMRQNAQITFRYCGEDSRISEEYNPDGSIENIAGVCNDKKNVFGIMPRPELAVDDELGNTDGKMMLNSFFQNI